MPTSELEVAREFVVRQRIKMVANEFFIETADGNPLAYARQKVMALRERVTFFTDESMLVPVFSFQARNAIDMKAVCDVFDGEGQQIGYFQKDFTRSLWRSRWNVDCAAGQFSGRERSAFGAIARRVVDLPMWYNFDFVKADGGAGFSIDRQMTVRDSYHVKVSDEVIDGRVVAALAVAMDVLQNR